MNVAHLCSLVFILLPGFNLAQENKEAVELKPVNSPSPNLAKPKPAVPNLPGADAKIKNLLINIAKQKEAAAKQKGDNTYLDDFLNKHAQPGTVWDNVKSFDLSIDPRHKFWPPLRWAPFRSTAEPWPMPKSYKTEPDKLYRMNRDTFRLELQCDDTNDILADAIRRYTVIIRDRVLEEPYDNAFNFNEHTMDAYEKARLGKYKEIGELVNLKIYVKNTMAGHPHLDMNETYTLKIGPGEATLRAEEVWGVLRGLETFSQILFRKRGTMETYVRWTDVEDAPRFPHRGILMDTARHYMHKYVIKNVLEGMAYNKFNVLHWHIVDDQSFPYKSQVYPNLSDKGAFHPTLVYSLKDIQEIVAYARLRGIRVVPEFDTPGHMFSWIGEPEMKAQCFTREGELVKGPIGPIDPVKNESYTFMSNLFTEIFETFPDVFVHLGGDEHHQCWNTDPAVTEFLEKNAGIPSQEAISNPQGYIGKAIGYYFKRLVGVLKDTGKKKSKSASFIMWEDVLKNTKEIPKDSILEIWMGKPAMVKSVNDMGYRTIYSSCWYLDNYKNFVLWVDYYKCDPSPYFNDNDEKGKLIGGEACLWAEYLTSDNLMTMMWPRASAPAERLWSPRSVKDIASAGRRIQEQRCRMIYRGLPTGHINGPDYCLRYRNEPLGGDDPLGIEGDGHAWGSSSAGGPGSMSMSVLMVTDYSKYLPFFNLALSVMGVYAFVVASRKWRRRSR